MPSPCPLPVGVRRTAAILLAAAALAWGQARVELDPPAGPLASGQAHRLEARVSGAAGGCHWAALEQGVRVGPGQGVRLAGQGDQAVLTVQGRAVARTIRVRATARQDPSAFAVVTVEVAPRTEPAETKDAPAPEAAGRSGASGAPEAAGGDPPVWETPFTRTGGRRQFNAMAWDPSSAAPSLVVLEDLGDRAQVLRLGLDGAETVISKAPPEGAGAWPDPPHLDRTCDDLAVLPGGDLAVSDGANHRICRVARDGTLSVLAGTGSADFNGDTDLEGRPRPALEAALGRPCGIAVTAAGEVVFADLGHHRVRRFRPGGTIETLAGSGQGPSPVDNDPDRRHPATAASLHGPDALAVAPDGRIVFTQVDGGPAVLHPDGTLERLADPKGYTSLVTVTSRNEIVLWDTHHWLVRIQPGGAPAVLSESRLPLQALAALPGGGVLALDLYQAAIWHIDLADGGWNLADRVLAADRAAWAGDPARAAELRAGLARWAQAVPPTAEAVRGLLRCGRGGTRLPGLVDDLQDLPWEFLRGDYTGQAIRARIALWALDRDLERRAPGGAATGPEPAGLP